MATAGAAAGTTFEMIGRGEHHLAVFEVVVLVSGRGLCGRQREVHVSIVADFRGWRSG